MADSEMVNVRVDCMRAATSMIDAFRANSGSDLANQAFNEFVAPGFEGSGDRAAFLAGALSLLAADLLDRLAIYTPDAELFTLDTFTTLAASQITRESEQGSDG